MAWCFHEQEDYDSAAQHQLSRYSSWFLTRMAVTFVPWSALYIEHLLSPPHLSIENPLQIESASLCGRSSVYPPLQYPASCSRENTSNVLYSTTSQKNATSTAAEWASLIYLLHARGYWHWRTRSIDLKKFATFVRASIIEDVDQSPVLYSSFIKCHDTLHAKQVPAITKFMWLFLPRESYKNN